MDETYSYPVRCVAVLRNSDSNLLPGWFPGRIGGDVRNFDPAFFKSRMFTRPAVPDPERVIPGHQDMTRQMVGEPALRAIYGRNGKFQPTCPDCGIEVGPGEPCEEVVIGDQLMEKIILSGVTATYRVHPGCTCPPREDLLRRLVCAILDL